MTKDKLLLKVAMLEKELETTKKLLPNVKTDGYIKTYRTKKDSFKFSYTKPSLDWFDTVDVVIQPDDYYYFEIEKRFGPGWWLIGKNAFNTPDYHWDQTVIGELTENDLIRFIKWAKNLNNDGGCPITSINVISGNFDIFEDIEKVILVLREEKVVL